MNYSREKLQAQMAEGYKPEFLFFFSHAASPDGQITKTCFSQWWPSRFTVEGITYLTAEHWMMAHKAELFEDYRIQQAILSCKTPSEARTLGKQVANFDEHWWNVHKYSIVAKGNWHKFTQDERLKAYLLTTGDSVLVEASPYDKVWGIGLLEGHPKTLDPTLWKGHNLLGFSIMEVRDKLRKLN